MMSPPALICTPGLVGVGVAMFAQPGYPEPVLFVLVPVKSAETEIGIMPPRFALAVASTL